MGWASFSRSLRLHTSAAVVRLNYTKQKNLSVCLHQRCGSADQTRSRDGETHSLRWTAQAHSNIFLTPMGAWFPLQTADSLLSDGIKKSVTCVQKHWGPKRGESCELRIIHLRVIAKIMWDPIWAHSAAEYSIICPRKVCATAGKCNQGAGFC